LGEKRNRSRLSHGGKEAVRQKGERDEPAHRGKGGRKKYFIPMPERRGRTAPLNNCSASFGKWRVSNPKGERKEEERLRVGRDCSNLKETKKRISESGLSRVEISGEKRKTQGW